MTDKDTLKFTVPSDDKENMRRILRNVYEALTEKGYNPVNQIVGYLLTEDPTYITNYNGARSMICKIDRDELMQALVREYLFNKDSEAESN
ncbi:MAG: IreB family regulatory phosphoprotein [Firmicutes bacterium]|nr:IreB family regulatory phosphoprotein [Bacillota bacterium]